MKRNIFLKISLTVVGIAVVALLALWGIDKWKYDNLSNVEVAQRLITFLNQQLPGSQVKADPQIAIVKKAGKGRYWVTLKKVSFTTDLTWIVNIIAETMANLYKNKNSKSTPFDKRPIPDTDSAQIAESFFLYGPKDNYLSARSIKGMAIEFDYNKSSTILPMDKGLTPIKIQCDVDKIIFSDFNIGEMIKAGKRQSGDIPVDPETGKEPRSNTTVEHIKLDALYLTENHENLSVLLEIEGIKSVNVGVESSEASTFMMKSDAPPLDLKKILERGLAINDFSVEVGKISIVIGKNGIPLAVGGVDSIVYSQFMKPDEKKAFFKLGYGLGLKKLALSIPGNRGMELLSKTNDFHFTFSIDHLGPEAMQGVLDFVRNSIVSREIPGGANTQGPQQQAMKFFMDIIASSPVITFSISPFRHYFGDMYAQVTLQSFFPPVGACVVKVKRITDVLAKMQAATLFSPVEFNKISDFLAQYFVRDKNGDASMLIQLRPNQPGKYFLNGIAFDLKPMNMPNK